MSSRLFHLGDVLSITAGPLVSPRGMDGVYEVLGFLTGEQLWTHQLLRAARECKPELLRRFPQLADVDGSSVNRSNWEAWLADQVAKFGEHLELHPLHPELVSHRDPVDEAIELFGQDRVIVVDPEPAP